jgi:DNA-binding transcriptional regulator YdaS (Cro superfamily)
MKQNKAILKLVKKYGSITELANQIGVSRTYVGHWLHGRRPIPVALVKKLALLSEGELKREDFRPDIFDDENI